MLFLRKKVKSINQSLGNKGNPETQNLVDAKKHYDSVNKLEINCRLQSESF